MYMRQGLADVSPSSQSLLLLKPRQVLLAEQKNPARAKSGLMAKKQPDNPARLSPENKFLLTHSVALWIGESGFSKTLKRFISEAQIQDDDWEAKGLNLEDVFAKYLETCDNGKNHSNSLKDQECQVNGSKEANEDNDHGASEHIESKKKKKKKSEHKEADSATSEAGPRDSEFPLEESAKDQKDKKKKKSKSTAELEDGDAKKIDVKHLVTEEKKKGLVPKSSKNNNEAVGVVESKDKKKKKKLKDSQPEDADNMVEADKDDIHTEKMKDKKKKKEANNTVSGSEVLNSAEERVDYSEKVSVEAADDGGKEHKKSSKKRKRLASEENEGTPAEELTVEESKRRKTEGLEEANGETQNTVHGTNRHAQNLSGFNTDMNGVEKSNQSKSARKQWNNSAEPKTVNAFQRVKIEEVKFADERLQDNSYWAKDGAEIGYGAKAQEVLGQVKGRDFRHEKTKKKRGSYRGGQIDLQSHSIKFNYSDDE